MTNKPNFIHNKKLDWAIDRYISSIATPVFTSLRYKLKKKILKSKNLIESYFDIRIAEGNLGDQQLFYTGNM